MTRPTPVIRFFYWLQLSSECAAIVMSVCRLCTLSFAAPEESTANFNVFALLIFYSLAAFQALVFLLERIYWEIQISGGRILSKVNERCGLSEEDLATTRRFFYDVYGKCLTDSIFEGLKMDMLDYTLAWLQSDHPDEQLGGIRVLLKFSQQEYTLQRLAAKQGAVERLLEMVTWKNPEQRRIRSAAADLLSVLVKYNRSAIACSIEAIFSLTNASDDDRLDDAGGSDYIGIGACEKSVAPVVVETHYVVGLRILKNLAKDPLNCAKIGQTPGLLTGLSVFKQDSDRMLRNAEEPCHKIALQESLELLNLLLCASGAAGKTLREEITKNVFSISNLCSILGYGESYIVLQQLAAEILCSLSMDEDLKETIGRTAGVMPTLLALLTKKRVEGEKPQVELSQKAGQVLALLALKSEQNCRRMMKWSIGECGSRDVVTALRNLIAESEEAGIVEDHPPAASEKGEESAAAAAMAERLVRILEQNSIIKF